MSYYNYKKIVHEHRAPTDDSVKILKECQDQAIKGILSSISVENNLIKGHVTLIDGMAAVARMEYTLIFKFQINNQPYEVTKVFPYQLDEEGYKLMLALKNKMRSEAEAVIMYYTLKAFPEVIYETLTGHKLKQPEEVIKETIKF
jgi:hypothetical protein